MRGLFKIGQPLASALKQLPRPVLPVGITKDCFTSCLCSQWFPRIMLLRGKMNMLSEETVPFSNARFLVS